MCTEKPLVCTGGTRPSAAQVLEPVVDSCVPASLANNPALAGSSFTSTFTPVCNVHAQCYGGKTTGPVDYFLKSRATCDNDLRNGMDVICSLKPAAQAACATTASDERRAHLNATRTAMSQ